jgi:sigma-E factor negative regulatory protein RseA
MKDGLGESLSALLDGEANELELERLLKQVEDSDDLRARWSRLNLASASLKGENVAWPELDISGQVRATLEAENGNSEEVHSGSAFIERVKKPLASFAVAASVAATVVFGGQQLAQLGGGSVEPVNPVASSSSPINSIGGIAVQANYGTAPIPSLEPATRTAYRKLAEQRLERYLQEHSEHAALNSHQGMITFARVSEIQE